MTPLCQGDRHHFSVFNLSRSMYVALETLREQGKIGDGSVATEQFCFKINRLFDVLNSSPSQRDRSSYHQELREESVGYTFI